MSAAPAPGLGHGDRFVFLGLGQRRGKHGTIVAVRRTFANVRFDDGAGMLCLAADCHPIPKRPPPMW